jgi:hypothetical protein
VRRKCFVIVSLLFIIDSLVNIGIFGEAEVKAEKLPSIVVLYKPSAALPISESMKLLGAAYAVFKESEVFEPICISYDRLGWEKVTDAVQFSKHINADYMVYMDISKKWGTYYYNAELVKPAIGWKMAAYENQWTDEPATTKKAMFEFASQVIFDSLGKITVYMTIESTPSYCDVYRDKDRLGHTGENGFRGNYYLKKGSYKIRVCKPDYEDGVDSLKVEDNPTEYSKYFELKRKR